MRLCSKVSIFYADHITVIKSSLLLAYTLLYGVILSCRNFILKSMFIRLLVWVPINVLNFLWSIVKFALLVVLFILALYPLRFVTNTPNIIIIYIFVKLTHFILIQFYQYVIWIYNNPLLIYSIFVLVYYSFFGFKFIARVAFTSSAFHGQFINK